MKKINIPLIALVLFLCSCGPNEADKAAVCGCEDLYTKMKNMEGEYQISDKISSSEAQKKVQSENQEAYDKCTQLHKDIGDDDYFKASQNCQAK